MHLRLQTHPEMKLLFSTGALLATCLFTACSHYSPYITDYLGNNFALVDGDARIDRTIIYCTGEGFSLGQAGLIVIPSDEASARGVYVDSALALPRWIEARTTDSKTCRKYWLIDKDFTVDLTNCDKVSCDSVIKAHLIGPLERGEFEKKCQLLGIQAQLN